MTSDVAERALAALRQARINYTSEREFGHAIARVFSAASIAYDSEVLLSGRSRVDLLLEGNLAVELKVRGSASSVLSQLHRYAACPRVAGVLLVTAVSRHVRGLPPTLCGKRLFSFWVSPL